MIYSQQYDITDCGAACLSMVFSHYKKHMTITEIRELAGTDINGTSLMGLKHCAEELNFKAVAVKCNNMEAVSANMLPCIAHIKPKNSESADHYVVIYKIRGKKVWIADPDPKKKKYKTTIIEFVKEWTGVLMFFSPSTNFKTDKRKNEFTLKDFLQAILKQRKLLIYALLSSVIILILGLFTSLGTKYIYDDVLFAKAKYSLIAILVGMLVTGLVSIALETARNIIVKHFSYKTDSLMNFSFVSHILRLPVSFFELRKTGEILSRLHDLSTVKAALSSIALSSLIDVLMVIVVGPFLFMVNKAIFGISVICALLIGICGLIFAKLFRKYYIKLKEETAESSAFLVDVITGISVVKAFNAEQMADSIYEKKQMKAIWTGWKTGSLSITQETINSVIFKLTNLSIMWIGCQAIFKEELSLGTLLFLITLSGYLINPLLRLVNLQSSLQEAFVSARRVGEILCLETEQQDKKLIKPKTLNGNIEFNEVCFHYGSRSDVLKNICLKIKAGTTVAFVGQSGCGKTTTIKLLMKFYNPDKGQILIDGNDIADYDNNSLRKLVGYVPQDVFLFPDTIANNISMCNDAVTLEKIIEVTKKAGIHNHIADLPDRYNTKLGENGSGLSGGEKQRIAIARALLNNPSIVILDEATSNLDVKSENKIHELLDTLKDEKTTVIIISHRESTIANCDKVFFFEDGKIMESGTHNGLLRKSDKYRKYWEGMSDENT